MSASGAHHADAAERFRRLLEVLPHFADGEEISPEELERRTGIDAGTLLEDLAALTDRDDEPAGFVSSVQAMLEPERVTIRTSHFLRPLRLTVPELCALELGLAMLAGSSAPDEQRIVANARARIRSAIVKMPAAERDEQLWHAVSPSGTESSALADLREALRSRRKARIIYRKGSGETASDRVVCTYALVPANDTWYLVAHCEATDSLRFFRLDRVESVTVLDVQYAMPANSLLERILGDGRPFHTDGSAIMTVRYSPRIARWIAEREKVPLAADGSLTLEHPLADEEWAVRHVLQYGVDAEVLAPESVRGKIVEKLRAMAG